MVKPGILMVSATVMLSELFLSPVAGAQEIILRYDKNGWDKGFQALAQGMKEVSGLDVSLQLQSPSLQYQGFIQTTVAAKSPPPLFTWWNGRQLDLLAETGQIADLSAAWDKAIAAGYFTEEEKSQVSSRGTPWAIPLNIARYPVFYRKDAFKKAGIPRPPETWEELLAAAEAVKAAGYVPFSAPPVGDWDSLLWFSEFMIRTNPDAFVGLNDGSVRYNGPEVQAAFDLWIDFFRKGYFTDPREDEGMRYFVNGKVAMWLTPEWYTGPVQNGGLAPGKDFGAFIMPRATPDVPDSIIAETAVIVVSKAALQKYPSLAAAIDYLFSPAAGNALATAPGTRIFNGNRKIDPPNAVVSEVNALVAARNPRLITRWSEAVPPDLLGDLLAQLGAFWLNPTAENATRVMNNMEAFNAEYHAGITSH